MTACKHGIHEGCLLCPEGQKLTARDASPIRSLSEMTASFLRANPNAMFLRDQLQAMDRAARRTYGGPIEWARESLSADYTVGRGVVAVRPSPRPESQETVPDSVQWFIEDCACSACSAIRQRREVESANRVPENSPIDEDDCYWFPRENSPRRS